VEEILELARFKRDGACRYLVVAGCLPARYGKPVMALLPEVDLFLSPSEIPFVVERLQTLRTVGEVTSQPTAGAYLMTHHDRRLVPPTPSAYVKIADGCSNRCTYCLIPRIRGPLRSRPPEDILQEAEYLSQAGVKEIILVAQDTTAYGRDLPSRPKLEELIVELAALPRVAWIRLLYAHPARVKRKLLTLMVKEEKLCAYLDLPIQHASDRILEAMNRHYRRRDVVRFLELARRIVPHIAVRTSLLVGFPGETERRFHDLVEFVRASRFDHLGVFTYWPEMGIKALQLGGRSVPSRVRQERQRILEGEQAIISWEIQQALIGTEQEILIEGRSDEAGVPWWGRMRRQAPEIDGVTYVRGQGIAIGDIIRGRIVAADTFDLFAESIH